MRRARFRAAKQESAAAVDVLLNYVKPNGDYFLAVAAWNALDYLDQRDLPALDSTRSLPTKWAKVPPRMGEYPTRLKQKTLADL